MENKLLDTYLTSKELKKLVIMRSAELEIPFRYICHEAGINYQSFMNGYINSSSPSIEMTESKFEKVLNMLGIQVRFQFVVTKNFKSADMRCHLKEKYENHINSKNGKNTGEKEISITFD